ncbi:ARF GTPase-activating domain-containing protein [Klebsormidium nitens]|uniref:ARF GTPase-activating domain-containing protein n=1 Tax=Klebsormidium nitens TaxID=105231 RepID=A0A1Y1HWJ5_KLENI|nr:ARF GTPase-activating domain-containing protein [Klebsormidium nitens]|eukprot:GAQ83014.1 ARF GTPase-activating domain-containing protein [Klebsormidium nitens]
MVADKNSVTKEQHERHKKILDALLKQPENRCCADCGSRGPRWASVNLGVFLCIQCSGIHRSLGVHISQVRSATLDTWLPDQVAFIQSMGNQKANEYWEAELPSNFKRPSEQDRPAVESFIRAKYERKAFVARERRRSKEDRPASRHEGGYNSDHGPASRPPQHEERRGGAGPSQAAPARPTMAVKVPLPRAAASPAAAVPAPRVATSTAPPPKVESAPALMDLLSLADSPPKAPTSNTTAAPVPAAAPAANAGGWAAFPEPGQAAAPAAAPSAAATAPATSAPAGVPASTMSALTDLFTASTPGGPATSAPAAATPEKPKKNATDIMSLFDQGSPFMNPQQAQLQQQMMYMQQQQMGGMPGVYPGAMPGVAMPGVVPGSMPGVVSGAMPGVVPGGMPGMFPQPGAHASPEPSSSHMPVGGPFVPGMMPGFAPYAQGMPPAGFPGFYAAHQPGFAGPYSPAQAGGPLGGLGGPEQYQPQAPAAVPSGPAKKDAPGAQYDFSDLQAFAK